MTERNWDAQQFPISRISKRERENSRMTLVFMVTWLANILNFLCTILLCKPLTVSINTLARRTLAAFASSRLLVLVPPAGYSHFLL